MKRTLLIIMIAALLQTVSCVNRSDGKVSYKEILASAEASIKEKNPLQAIELLQNAYLDATDCYYDKHCNGYQKTETLEKIANNIDSFLNHVTVSQVSEADHNILATIVLKYDDIPLELEPEGDFDYTAVWLRFINGKTFVYPSGKTIQINPIHNLASLINKRNVLEEKLYNDEITKYYTSTMVSDEDSIESDNKLDIEKSSTTTVGKEKTEKEENSREVLAPGLEYRVIKRVEIVKKLFEKSKPNEIFEAVRKKHWLQLDIKSAQESKLFYVPKEDLYYAAIKSNDLPEFAASSESQTENFAICVNAVLEFSGIKSDYSFILKDYLKIDKNDKITDIIKTYFHRIGDISGRETQVNSHYVGNLKQYLTEELTQGRIIISIDKKGESALVTAISLKKDADGYIPVNVRMRMPSLPKGKQRKEMSWKEFEENGFAIVAVYIN